VSATIVPPLLGEDEDEPRVVLRNPASPVDRIYRLGARAAASVTLAVIVLIGVFLLSRSLPALRLAKWKFLTEAGWNPDSGVFGISAVLLGTVLIALVALAVALPVAIGASLFLTEYAPRRLQRVLTSMVDLLAAIPGLIYGLWGLFFLQPRLIHVSRWLTTHLAFLPFFKTSSQNYASTTFIAGVVVSLMVAPVCTSVMREVFAQAPLAEKEGALALGATRWGMVRTVVLPFGRGGMIGGAMLGLGRALGDTIAVSLIISPIFIRTGHILDGGGNSIASLIALRFSESSHTGISALMAAGLALFAVTLIVNAVATIIVDRSRSGSATEA